MNSLDTIFIKMAQNVIKNIAPPIDPIKSAIKINTPQLQVPGTDITNLALNTKKKADQLKVDAANKINTSAVTFDKIQRAGNQDKNNSNTLSKQRPPIQQNLGIVR
jgi:hypothetical protein